MRKITAIIALAALLAAAVLPAGAEGWFTPSAGALPAGTKLFEFDKLDPNVVKGSTVIENGGIQYYTVTLQPGIDFGGSAGYAANWVTDEGALCETEADLDGDGENELLVYEIVRREVEFFGYPDTAAMGDLVIHEKENGLYREVQRIRSVGAQTPMGESAVFLTQTSAGAFLCDVLYGMGDGAVSSVLANIYRYDGTEAKLVAKMAADNMGASWFIQGVDVDTTSDAWYAAIDAYEKNGDAAAFAMMGLWLGGNFHFFPAHWDESQTDYRAKYYYEAFDKAAELLRGYGLTLSYQVNAAERYCDTIAVSGGKRLYYCNDLPVDLIQLELMTGQNHGSGTPTGLSQPATQQPTSEPTQQPGGQITSEPTQQPAAQPTQQIDWSDAFSWGETPAEKDDYTVSSMETGAAHATANVNMRENPGKGSKLIATIPSGKNVELLGDAATGRSGERWVHVRYDGRDGWAVSTCIAGGEAPKQSEKKSESSGSSSSSGKLTTTANVNMRASATKNSTYIGTIPKGKTVEYLGDSDKDERGVTWYRVRYDGKTGWISSNLTTKGSSGGSSSSGSSSSGKSSTGKETGIQGVTTGSVNMRKAPNLKGELITSISKGKTVDYRGEKSVDERGVTWYLVKYNGKIGWVSSKYLKKAGSGSSDSSKSDGTKLITTGSLNFRKEPNLKGELITSITKGKTLDYLGEKSTDERGVVWYKIKYNGKTGWVSSKYSKFQ